jgi:hypothetical protein
MPLVMHPGEMTSRACGSESVKSAAADAAGANDVVCGPRECMGHISISLPSSESTDCAVERIAGRVE